MNTRLWRMVRIMVTMLSLTMLVGLAGPVGAQEEDPKDDCKKGGWETLTTAEGDAFKNQGGCVSYVAADGGVPVPATVLTVTFDYDSSASWPCSWDIFGSGFPSGDYQLQYIFSDPYGTLSFPAFAENDGTLSGQQLIDSGPASLQVEAYASDGNGNPVGDPVAVSNLATCPSDV